MSIYIHRELAIKITSEQYSRMTPEEQLQYVPFYPATERGVSGAGDKALKSIQNYDPKSKSDD